MEEVKKTKTTTKKKEEKDVVKKTAKKAAPKKEIKTTKTVKKTTKKEELAKKPAAKKVVKKETPKKETKKVEKKTVTKKTTSKTSTKAKSTKKNTNKFMPTASEWENIEAQREEIEFQQLKQQIYDSVFDHFYEKPLKGASLKFDSSWETSNDSEIRDIFVLAKNEAYKCLENEKDVIKGIRYDRQVEINEIDLVTDIAETLHNEWCDNEIKEFYDRARVAKGNSSQGIENILNAACYKKGKKTNEISYTKENLETNKDALVQSLEDFDLFKTFVGKDNTYVVEVRKYVKRNLADSEKQADFKASTQEENILRPYDELSMVSKSENISAAERAVFTYKELASAGISLNEMKNDEFARELVEKSMHVMYLKDHKDEKTYFKDLDIDVKQKDLKVFDVLINIVENNRGYNFYPVVGVTVPNYDQLERDIINGVDKEKPVPKVQAKSAYEVEKMIEAMENNAGDEKENEVVKQKVKDSTLGYVGVWMTAIATAGLTTMIFALAAFYLG